MSASWKGTAAAAAASVALCCRAPPMPPSLCVVASEHSNQQIKTYIVTKGRSGGHVHACRRRRPQRALDMHAPDTAAA